MKQRTLRLVFDGFLLLLGVVLTVYSFHYSFRARIIPLVVLLLIDLMVLLQLLADWSPKLEKKWRFLRTQGMNFSPALGQKSQAEKPIQQTEGYAAKQINIVKLLRILLWLVAVYVAMLYVNYVFLFPVVVFLLMTIEFKEKLTTSILLAVITGIFNYGLFFQLLNLRM